MCTGEKGQHLGFVIFPFLIHNILNQGYKKMKIKLENIIKTTEQALWNDIIFWLLSRHETYVYDIIMRLKNMIVGFKWC